jgi:small Trp-rich protein
MWMVVLGVLLILLKVGDIGPFGMWSWWAVLWPFVVAVVWWAWADSSGWTKRREMDKMDAKKADRRSKNLANLGMDERGRRMKGK